MPIRRTPDQLSQMTNPELRQHCEAWECEGTPYRDDLISYRNTLLEIAKRDDLLHEATAEAAAILDDAWNDVYVSYGNPSIMNALSNARKWITASDDERHIGFVRKATLRLADQIA